MEQSEKRKRRKNLFRLLQTEEDILGCWGDSGNDSLEHPPAKSCISFFKDGTLSFYARPFPWTARRGVWKMENRKFEIVLKPIPFDSRPYVETVCTWKLVLEDGLYCLEIDGCLYPKQDQRCFYKNSPCYLKPPKKD